MPLTALADQDDATDYGYGTVASGYFNRASARVRRYAKARGYSVDTGTYTVVARGPVVALPNQPITSITSVTDVENGSSELLTTDEWELRSGGTLDVPTYGGNLSIVYVGGVASYSDSLIELVCAIASRMSNTAAGAATGVQQETGGSESVTYGFDAYTGISDLTKGELASLSAMFPAKPALVVLRAAEQVIGSRTTRFDV